MKSLISAILVLAVIVGGVYIYKKHKNNPPAPAGSNVVVAQPVKATNVQIFKADISATSTSKLPPGFPTNIPVELATINQSLKEVFGSQPIHTSATTTVYTATSTIYTVNYTSAKTKDILYKLYTDFFTKNGYTLDPKLTDFNKGIMHGYTANKVTIATTTDKIIRTFSQGNELYVTISDLADSKFQIQLNYIQR